MPSSKNKNLTENTTSLKIQTEWKYSFREKTASHKKQPHWKYTGNLCEEQLTEITTWVKLRAQWKYNLSEYKYLVKILYRSKKDRQKDNTSSMSVKNCLLIENKTSVNIQSI